MRLRMKLERVWSSGCPKQKVVSVKERLGHSDIQTTMNIYAHVTTTERDKTADLFGSFMNAMHH